MSEDKTKETQHSDDTYERVCMLCRRPESKVSSMISLPNNICICSDCMQKSFDSMNNSNINYDALDPMEAEKKLLIAESIKYGVMIVSTVPVLCLYPFLQKYFVKGVMIGSVKE